MPLAERAPGRKCGLELLFQVPLGKRNLLTTPSLCEKVNGPDKRRV